MLSEFIFKPVLFSFAFMGEMSKEKPRNWTVDSKRSWFILAAAFLSLFGVGGLQMSFGTILAHLVQQFDESKTKTVWIGSLLTFFLCVTSPLTIFLSQRHGIRTTQFIGGIFLTLGIVTTSLMESVNYMFLTYSVVVGIGGGLVTAPALAIIPDIFDKYVSIAMSIGVSGITLGLMFFSFVLPTLLDGLGWRKTLWILSAIGPLISLCGLAFPGANVKPGECSGSADDDTNKDTIEKGGDKNEQHWWKSIKKKAFMLWLIVIFLYGLIEYVPLFLVALCAQESGVPSSQTKWLNIIYGVGELLGKLITGPLAQLLLKRDQSKYLHLITLFSYSLSSFLISLNTEFQWLSFYMTLIGFLHGVSSNMFYIVTLEIVGVASYPTVCGFITSLGAFSWTIGPPLAAIFYVNLSHVRYLLLAISGTCFLATISMAIIPCVTPRRIYTLHQQDYDYWRVYCHNPDITPRTPRKTRVFTIKDAKEDIRHSKPHTLSRQTHNITISQTQLVGAEEVQFA